MSLISRAGLDPRSWLVSLRASSRVIVICAAGFFLSWLVLRVLTFPTDQALMLAIYDAGGSVALAAWTVASVASVLWMPMVFWLYVFRKNRYEWTSAVLIAVATIISMVSVDLLKDVFMLPRPPDVLSTVVYRPDAGVPTNLAFPSGHTSRAFTLAAVVWGRYPKWRIPFTVLAVATGISMIVVGRHFPSDVLAGAFVGIMIGSFAVNLGKARPD